VQGLRRQVVQTRRRRSVDVSKDLDPTGGGGAAAPGAPRGIGGAATSGFRPCSGRHTALLS